MARIEILAGMGSGKTSLAKLLEEQGFTHIEEAFEKNPFLEDVYDPKLKSWLPYGVSNLMLHYDQLVRNADPACDYVFDFSLILDRAYAQAHIEKGLLNAKETQVYDRLDALARAQAPKPDLRIVLLCPPEEQKRRILERGRSYESGISLEFLESMARNVMRFLDERGRDTKVLMIDTIKYDYVRNPEHRRQVLQMITQELAAPGMASAYKQKPFGPRP